MSKAVHVPLPRDAKACEHAAAALWAIATSDDRSLTAYDSHAYRAAERAFVTLVREVYRVSPLVASRVRDLLADLGPDDGAYGYPGYGVESYVAYCRDHRNYR